MAKNRNTCATSKRSSRNKCFSCHGALEQEGGLRLDTRQLMLAGGDSGPAVVPGSPETSLLVERISATDASERMPPEGEPVTREQIERITQWIASGAEAPTDEQPQQDPTASLGVSAAGAGLRLPTIDRSIDSSTLDSSRRGFTELYRGSTHAPSAAVSRHAGAPAVPRTDRTV